MYLLLCHLMQHNHRTDIPIPLPCSVAQKQVSGFNYIHEEITRRVWLTGDHPRVCPTHTLNKCNVETNLKPSLSVMLSMLQISNLKENMVYQFQVAAINIAGLGAPSAVSPSFKCEEWTIAVPGNSGRPCLSTEAQSFFQWILQFGTKFKCYIASKGDKFSRPLMFM